MARRKRNPSTAAIAVGLLLAGTVGYVIYEEVKKPTGKTKGGSSGGVSPLSGYYTPGSTLANAPGVMSKIVLPVSLSFEPMVRNPQTGNLAPAGGNIVTPEVLPYLVTNLTPQATIDAFGYMQYLISSKGMDLRNSSVRDDAVKQTLNKTGARKVDWSKGLQPYTVGSAEFDVWQGVQLLGELAFGTQQNQTGMG